MNNLNISLTANAAAHLKSLLLKEETSKVLHVGVKQTGCSGLAYTFNFVDHVTPSYASHAFEGMTIQSDLTTASLLSGATLDLVSKGLSNNLTFSNPNESARCGCGESFQVKV